MSAAGAAGAWRRSRAANLAAAEAWLRSPRGLLLLWAASTAALAAVLILMRQVGVPGWDDPAHGYKVFLIRDGQSIFWDDFWYGGSYGAITYGFVFYYLAQLLPAKIIVVVAGGLVPLFFHIYQRDMWGIDDIWPAWLLTGVMAAYMAHGQDPFVLALALTLGGLALLARRHPVLGGLVVGIGVFANPMGVAVGAVFMLTDFLARPETRRRYAAFIALLALFVVARVLLGWAFAEPGGYLNETEQLLLYLAFAFAGVGLAGVNAAHARRPFVILFATYAVVCVASFVMPESPVGNNSGRFFFVFALPLLFLLRHSRLQRPFPYGDLAMIPIIVFAILQLGAPYSHLTSREERLQTTPGYFAPALAEAARLHNLDYRFHVVALRRHWEALYFPEAGYAITRGWYRQADAIHSRLFYEVYEAAEYEAWLRGMGVEYIFLPDASVDAWSRREVSILRTSPAFETVATRGHWTVLRLRDPEPLVTGRGGATGRVLAFDHLSVRFTVDAPGTYLVKVSWSPYWQVVGRGALRESSDGFVALDAAHAGTYELRFSASAGEALAQIGARFGF